MRSNLFILIKRIRLLEMSAGPPVAWSHVPPTVVSQGFWKTICDWILVVVNEFMTSFLRERVGLSLFGELMVYPFPGNHC